eukprot:2658536-Rhodomonas_salina.1
MCGTDTGVLSQAQPTPTLSRKTIEMGEERERGSELKVYERDARKISLWREKQETSNFPDDARVPPDFFLTLHEAFCAWSFATLVVQPVNRSQHGNLASRVRDGRSTRSHAEDKETEDGEEVQAAAFMCAHRQEKREETSKINESQQWKSRLGIEPKQSTQCPTFL